MTPEQMRQLQISDIDGLLNNFFARRAMSDEQKRRVRANRHFWMRANEDQLKELIADYEREPVRTVGSDDWDNLSPGTYWERKNYPMCIYYITGLSWQGSLEQRGDLVIHFSVLAKPNSYIGNEDFTMLLEDFKREFKALRTPYSEEKGN